MRHPVFLYSLILFLLLIKSGEPPHIFPCVAFAETAAVLSLVDDAVISTAESAFKAMKQRNYPALWEMLSRKSQKTIVDNVAKAAKKAGAGVGKAEVSRDFAEGGAFARAYWDSYLTAFDPDAVLEHSRWELGPIGKKEAKIIIQHQKADQPAHLKLFRENGLWRVGLEETFAGRRFLMGNTQRQ